MNIITVENRNSELMEQLLNVWESSVRVASNKTV